MDGDKKKRDRTEANSEVERHRSKAQEQDRKAKWKKAPLLEISDGTNLMENPATHRPLGVFEFPWQNEAGALAPELDVCSLRDVFFSSLVDGCSAAIGFPGARISPPKASLIVFSGDADGPSAADWDADGTDCIWSCALQQPLSATYCRGFGA